jgi:hypothetical protein
MASTASTTRCWRAARRALALAAATLLAACHGGGAIESARIDGGATPALDASLKLAPTADLLAALDRGVPLVLRMDLRARGDGLRLHAVRRIELRFRPLSRQYAWTDLDSGAARTFARRPLLLAALDRVRLPLDAGFADLPPGTRLTLALALDVDALPPPLRLPALFSPRWRLATPEYAWTVGA